MRLPILFILIFLSAQAVAEEITYDMSVWGMSFGQMTVSRTVENDSTEIYSMEASGKVNFLWMRKEGKTNYKVKIVNGQMVSSSYIRIINGETEYWNEVVFDGEKYVVESNTGNRSFTEIPAYSVLELYFNPTTEHKRVYCEAESEFSTLSSLKEDVFELNCTDGSRTSYFLKDGKIERLDIHAAMATLKMKRVN